MAAAEVVVAMVAECGLLKGGKIGGIGVCEFGDFWLWVIVGGHYLGCGNSGRWILERIHLTGVRVSALSTALSGLWMLELCAFRDVVVDIAECRYSLSLSNKDLNIGPPRSVSASI